MPSPKKRVDQCARHVSRPGVNGHPRGFVNGDHVVVFVKHLQRNRFRFGACRGPRLRPNNDEFPAVKFLRGFRCLAIDEDKPAVDKFLYARPRQFRAMRGHKPVQPRSGVRIHRQ